MGCCNWHSSSEKGCHTITTIQHRPRNCDVMQKTNKQTNIQISPPKKKKKKSYEHWMNQSYSYYLLFSICWVAWSRRSNKGNGVKIYTLCFLQNLINAFSIKLCQTEETFLTPSVPGRIFIFILLTIAWFYTASETHVGMKISEDSGH